ncbi:hypothetical protein Br6_05021 [Rhodococcus sp. Br-6]|nr:hypothetical protein Br6_05021 [Rhodococcus sp. Br-6]
MRQPPGNPRQLAAQRLARKRRLRAIHAAIAAGAPSPDIEARFGLSARELSRVAQRLEISPEIVDRSPEDVIWERATDEVNDDQMMTELRGWPYTFAIYPDEPLADGMIPGSWNEVLTGYYDDLLTEGEIYQLTTHVQPPRRGASLNEAKSAWARRPDVSDEVSEKLLAGVEAGRDAAGRVGDPRVDIDWAEHGEVRIAIGGATVVVSSEVAWQLLERLAMGALGARATRAAGFPTTEVEGRDRFRHGLREPLVYGGALTSRFERGARLDSLPDESLPHDLDVILRPGSDYSAVIVVVPDPR